MCSRHQSLDCRPHLFIQTYAMVVTVGLIFYQTLLSQNARCPHHPLQPPNSFTLSFSGLEGHLKTKHCGACTHTHIIFVWHVFRFLYISENKYYDRSEWKPTRALVFSFLAQTCFFPRSFSSWVGIPWLKILLIVLQYLECTKLGNAVYIKSVMLPT